MPGTCIHLIPHSNPLRNEGPERSDSFPEVTQQSVAGHARGERGSLPCREAPGLVPTGALTGGLCFRYGSYMVWKELGGFSEEAVVPLGLYAGQLTLNWAWPPIFFGTRQMGWVSVSLVPGDGPWRGGPPWGDMGITSQLGSGSKGWSRAA